MDTGAWLAIFAIMEKTWGNVTRGQMESMRRLAPVIPSVPIKDHTVVGTSVEIERMPLT